MTPEGYKQIEDEIARLKKDRPRRIKILQAARALGDLSENTPWFNTLSIRSFIFLFNYTKVIHKC